MTKRVLELIGDFRECDYVGGPSLVELRGRRPPAHKADVVRYLRAGKCISMSPGFMMDYFDPTEVAGSQSLYTDGTYVWPKFLSHYVEKYDVALPEPFESHMRSRSWAMPSSIDVNELTLPWSR